VADSASQSTGMPLGLSVDQSSLTVALVQYSSIKFAIPRPAPKWAPSSQPTGAAIPNAVVTGFLQLVPIPEKESAGRLSRASKANLAGCGRNWALGTPRLTSTSTRLSSSPHFFAVCSLPIWGGLIVCAVGGRGRRAFSELGWVGASPGELN
jgi:hypothetical protein